MSNTKNKPELPSNVAPIKNFNEPPEGLEKIGSPDIDGYYEPKSKQVACGRIVGWKTLPTKFGSRDVVLIQLAQDCMAVIKDGDVNKVERLAVGKIIAIGMNADQGLQELNTCDRGTAVWLQCTGEKRKTKKGEMWIFEVRAAKNRRTRRNVKVALAEEMPDNMPEDSSDDIPF